MRTASTALIFAALAAAPALAQTQPRIQTMAEAVSQDAEQYARQNDVDVPEAVRRLRAQEESVAITDQIQRSYADRLAGISIEHRPAYRIVVLLTGFEPVPDRTIFAGGMNVPVVFRTGATATRDQMGQAIVRHRAAIRAVLPGAQGMGVDMRSGALAVMVKRRLDPLDRGFVEADLSALTGVPVRIRLVDEADANLSLDGGSRVEGVDPRDGLRYACTTGFVVTDAVRTGIVTAAHCPDALTSYDPAGVGTPLAFVGQWGVAFQDVQVHTIGASIGAGSTGGGWDAPLFYADADRRSARTLTGARGRTSTRAGDAVCHRGEATGYSCSQVDLVDYAPPGDLCAGPCDPVWTTVTGPSCRGGDSGGPIFNGTVAFGITKGGSYGVSGRCGFYYYMSTDFLPEGWSLLFDKPSAIDIDG